MFIFILFYFLLIHTFCNVSSIPSDVILKLDKTVPYFDLSNIHPQCPKIQIIFDTGSSDFWIADKTCTECPIRQIDCLKYLDSENIVGKQIHYASGWVKGYQVQYQFCGNIYSIICVTKAKNIQQFKSHGILGAGGNDTGRKFLNQLFSLSSSKQKYISLFNRRYSKRLFFNKIDQLILPLKYQNQVSSIKLSSDNQWNVQINKLSFNNNNISIQNPTILVDTGSQLITLPPNIFEQAVTMFQNILNTQCTIISMGISCPCQNSYSIHKIPQIQFMFDKNKQIYLPSIRYVKWKQKTCIIQITNVPSIQNKIIVGTPFINQFPVSFDYQNENIFIISYDSEKLNRDQNINIIILILIVVMIGLIGSRICIEIGKRMEQPDKLVI